MQRIIYSAVDNYCTRWRIHSARGIAVDSQYRSAPQRTESTRASLRQQIAIHIAVVSPILSDRDVAHRFTHYYVERR